MLSPRLPSHARALMAIAALGGALIQAPARAQNPSASCSLSERERSQLIADATQTLNRQEAELAESLSAMRQWHLGLERRLATPRLARAPFNALSFEWRGERVAIKDIAALQRNDDSALIALTPAGLTRMGLADGAPAFPERAEVLERVAGSFKKAFGDAYGDHRVFSFRSAPEQLFPPTLGVQFTRFPDREGAQEHAYDPLNAQREEIAGSALERQASLLLSHAASGRKQLSDLLCGKDTAAEPFLTGHSLEAMRVIDSRAALTRALYRVDQNDDPTRAR